MIKLNDEIKRMLNALAYAHTGENLTPREKRRVMAGGTPRTVAMEPTAVPKLGPQVGLYLGSELPSDLMHYVMQTCSRLRHGLTVFTLQSETDARALLKPYQTELEATGISVHLAVLSGEPPAVLVHALRKRAEIAFLICNESGYLGRSLMKGIIRHNAFPVPVVMVAASGTAMLKPEPAESASVRAA